MKTLKASLVVLVSFCFSAILFAQTPAKKAESNPADKLEPVKATFAKGDSIEFVAKLATGFMAPTISCSCSNKDFFYRVYKKENGEWKMILDHTEKADAKKCDCKVQYAIFVKDRHAFIAPVKDKGEFYIEVIGLRDAKLVSLPFTVE